VKYLCLGYYDEARFDAMTPEEVRALVSRCKAFDDELQATGRVEMVASLGPSKSSVSLRPRDGGTKVVDGPYAEAKEIIGSFFLIEANDIAEAIAVAAKHPAARMGEAIGWGIELRPIEFCRAQLIAAA
jgi:hypothetical protein